MKIEIRWNYAHDIFDTKDVKLRCVHARGKRVMHPDEIDAVICINNLAIAEIHTGDKDTSNALADEICRRFNEFPQEQKL